MKQKEEIIKQYVTELNNRNYDVIEELVAENVLLNGNVISQEQYKQQIKDRINEYPNYLVKIIKVESKEDWIILNWERTGTNKNTGQQLKEELTSEYRIINGKISEVQ